MESWIKIFVLERNAVKIKLDKKNTALAALKFYLLIIVFRNI